MFKVRAAFVTPRFPVNVASGWTFNGIATGLVWPRTLVFDNAGHLLVLDRGTGILGYTLAPDGSVASTTTVWSDEYLSHGLALSIDGCTLYARYAIYHYSLLKF